MGAIDIVPGEQQNRCAVAKILEGNSMASKEFRCLVCEQPEQRCTCIKYCALCHSDYGLRLTEDGQYYCADCREACDYKSQDQV